MTRNELPQLLRRLHTELEHAQTLDPESKRLLGLLADDLSRLDSHASTARDVAAKFEANHPDLAATLRQIADTFVKAGM